MDFDATELIGGHHLLTHKLEMEGQGSTILSWTLIAMAKAPWSSMLSANLLFQPTNRTWAI